MTKVMHPQLKYHKQTCINQDQTTKPKALDGRVKANVWWNDQAQTSWSRVSVNKTKHRSIEAKLGFWGIGNKHQTNLRQYLLS